MVLGMQICNRLHTDCCGVLCELSSSQKRQAKSHLGQ